MKERIDKEVEDVFREVIQEDFLWSIKHDNEMLTFLVRLSLVENKQLKTLTIDLISLLHSQFDSLKTCLDKVIFIEKKHDIQYSSIQEKAAKLRDLSETAEKWLLLPASSEQSQLRLALDEIERILVNNSRIISNDIDEELPKSLNHRINMETVEVYTTYKNLNPIYKHVIDFSFLSPYKFSQNIYRHLGLLECKPLLISRFDRDIGVGPDIP